jgi:fructokinase
MNNNRINLFGEVLFDVFSEDEQVLGGAPFNVAWHCQAFLLQPLFFSRVGDDKLGSVILQAMHDWQMDCSELQLDPQHPTGAVRVFLNNGEPSYSILADQAYDFIDNNQFKVTNTNGILYYGTLALRHLVSRQTLLALKANHQGDVFIDINLRAPWWQKDDVLTIIQGASWVKMNLDEFNQLHNVGTDLKQSMAEFLQQHGLKNLLLTLGEQGALFLNNEGEFFSVVPVNSVQIVDSVGAGDAFSAVALLGIQLNWPVPVILQRAQDFASALLGQRGATVQNQQFYEKFRLAWDLKAS